MKVAAAWIFSWILLVCINETLGSGGELNKIINFIINFNNTIFTIFFHVSQFLVERQFSLSAQGRHCPTLAGMARVETPVSFAHLISFLAIFSCFLPLCHRILPIVSPVFELFKTPGMAIAIPAILVSPPLPIR